MTGDFLTNANEARRILGQPRGSFGHWAGFATGVALAMLIPFAIQWWSRRWIAQRLGERFRGRLRQI